jgi:phospholipid transport system substrate-binding protein
MTAQAAGRFWRQATPEQQKQLSDEFRTLLVYTYSGALSQIKNETVEFKPFRADPADTDVEVRSQVNLTRGEPITLNYRLSKGPQGWKIYRPERAGRLAGRDLQAPSTPKSARAASTA